MNIFLDTNVYLSFYHFSSDDLEELKKLVVLAREKKINLLLPNQVIDEFYRNRESKIADAIKKFKENHKFLQFPQITRQYEEYKKLKDAQIEINKQLNFLLERLEKDIDNNSLEADSVIEELFQVAQIIQLNDKMISKARLRMELGRPPGKKGSLGDAVNWEALLSKVECGEDLYIVSDDSDYESALMEGQFSTYLTKEWNKAKNSEVYFYKRLSSLFNEKFPDIELATELEKDLLIKELTESMSFANTHNIISRLSKFSDFSRSQINDIVKAAVSNNQVYWIAQDSDIKTFFDSLLKDKENLVDSDSLKRLKYALTELEPYHDLPF